MMKHFIPGIYGKYKLHILAGRFVFFDSQELQLDGGILECI